MDSSGSRQNTGGRAPERRVGAIISSRWKNWGGGGEAGQKVRGSRPPPQPRTALVALQ